MSMPDAQIILDSFRRLVRALRLNSQDVQARCGLSGAQLFVLQKLKRGEELSVNEIAERTKTDQSSVSVVISKLVAKKMLNRKISVEDARKSMLSLTVLGEKTASRSQNLVQDKLLNAIGKLSADDRKKLAVLLQNIVNTAELQTEPAALFFEDEGKKKRGKKLSN